MFSIKKVSVLFLILLSLLFIVGCDDDSSGATDTYGIDAMVKVLDEPVGANCRSGGQLVQSGNDVNINGILDEDEVVNSEYICNGTDGTNGNDGANGNDGVKGDTGATGLPALVLVTDESSSQNCKYGGQRIEVGLDSNRNTLLDPSEVTQTSYICNVTPTYTPRTQVKARMQSGYENIIKTVTTQGGNFELISASNADCNTSALYNCDNLNIHAISNSDGVTLNADNSNYIWLKNAYQTSKRVNTKALHFAERYDTQVVNFKNKLWLIGGYDGTDYKNDVWSSSDGVNWTEESAIAAFSARRNHQVVTFNDKLWLIGGSGGGERSQK